MPGGGARADQLKPLDADTIKLIVAALSVNGGTVAKKALDEVLRGTLKNDNDPVATQSMLESLVRYRAGEAEEILLAAIVTPESLRPAPKEAKPSATGAPMGPPGMGMPPGGPSMPMPAPGMPAPGMPAPGMPAPGMSSGYPMPSPSMSSGYPGMGGYMGMGMGGSQAKVTAAQLQSMALVVAAPMATEKFRIQLANALTEKKTDDPYRGPLAQFLLQPNPENLAAQFILLKGTAIDAAAKAIIYSYLTTYSSQALCVILGIPSPALKETIAQGRAAGPAAGYPPTGTGMPMSGYPGPSSTSGMPPSGATPYPGMPPPGGGANPNPTGMPMSRPMGPPGPGTGPSTTGMPMGMYPGMGPSSSARTASPLSVLDLAKQYAQNPELAYRVGKQLWSDQTVALVNTRLEGVQSLRDGAAEILMAGTVPTDAIRAKLYETLRAKWEEGSKSLESAGLGGAVITDPGFLTVLKSLPRKDQKPETVTALQRSRRDGASKGARGGSSTTPSPGRPTAGPSGPGQPGAGQQSGQTPDFQWMDACELLTRAMCEQFAAAAKDAAAKGVTVAESTRPVEIPPSANVTAEYHLDWPKGLSQPGGLAGVSPDPMTIHYIRMEQKSSPTKIFGYFRRRVFRPEEHPVSKGFWMESFRPVPKTDRQLSVDILVTRKEDIAEKPASGQGATTSMPGMPPGMPGRPAGGPPTMSSPMPTGGPPGSGTAGKKQAAQRERAEKEEVGDLIVEILTVEVKSPAPPAHDAGDEDQGESSSKKTTPGSKGSSKSTVIE